MAGYNPPSNPIIGNSVITREFQAFFHLPEDSDEFAPLEDKKRATHEGQEMEMEFFKILNDCVDDDEDRKQIHEDVNVIERKLSWIMFCLEKPETEMIALYHIVRLYNHLCDNVHPMLQDLLKDLEIEARKTEEVGVYCTGRYRLPLMIRQVLEWILAQYANITNNLDLIRVVAVTGDMIKDILILLTVTRVRLERFVEEAINPLHSLLLDVKDKESLVQAFNRFTKALPDYGFTFELLGIREPLVSWEADSEKTALTCEQLLEKLRIVPVFKFLEAIAKSDVKIELDFYDERVAPVRYLVDEVHMFLQIFFKVDTEDHSDSEEDSEQHTAPLLRDVLKEAIKSYVGEPMDEEQEL